MKKKLLLIGNHTIHTYNYYHLIRDYFDEVYLITDEPVRQEQGVEKLKVVSFSYKKLQGLFGTVGSIRKIIREFRPDIIHVHQANSVALYATRAARAFDIPVVLTTWGSDILVAPHHSSTLRSIARYVIRQADVVTADAELLGNAVLDLVPEAAPKLVVANFGIELMDITLPKEDIIYSNRLHKKLYNIDVIIRAYKELEDTGRNPYRLVIAAVGEDTALLKQQVAELGLTDRVEFKGWLSTEENIRMYQRSKIYVSIPDSDATSISLLEAMYYGCYPVVSGLPSKKEWITDGVNGHIFRGDFKFMLDLDHKTLEAAEARNKKIILEKGTKEIAYKKFTDIYTKLLS